MAFIAVFLEWVFGGYGVVFRPAFAWRARRYGERLPLGRGGRRGIRRFRPPQVLMPILNIAPAKVARLVVGPLRGGFERHGIRHRSRSSQLAVRIADRDVLVALETNAAAEAEDCTGISGLGKEEVMKRDGLNTPVPTGSHAAGYAGFAGYRRSSGLVCVRGGWLNSPTAWRWWAISLVAESDAVVSLAAMAREQPGPRGRRAAGDLPAGPINHQGRKICWPARGWLRLYATVGSNSNAGENGLPAEVGSGSGRPVWEIDPSTGHTGSTRPACAIPTASPGYGHRGAGPPDRQGSRINGGSGVNERTRSASDLVPPDYMTAWWDGGLVIWISLQYYGHPWRDV